MAEGEAEQLMRGNGRPVAAVPVLKLIKNSKVESQKSNWGAERRRCRLPFTIYHLPVHVLNEHLSVAKSPGRPARSVCAHTRSRLPGRDCPADQKVKVEVKHATGDATSSLGYAK